MDLKKLNRVRDSSNRKFTLDRVIDDNTYIEEPSDNPLGPLTKEQADKLIAKLESIEGVAKVRYRIPYELAYPGIAHLWVSVDEAERVTSTINGMSEFWAQMDTLRRRRYIRPYGDCILVFVYLTD